MSYLRRNTSDFSRERIKSDDMHFEFIDEAIRKICVDTKCLQLPVFIKLEPGVWDYSNASIVQTIGTILQAEKVEIVDKAGKTLYRLENSYKTQFQNYLSDDCITEPKYYYLTDSSFWYSRPVDDYGYYAKIFCSRVPLPGERVDFDRDPVIPGKYLPFVKYGAMIEIADAYPELDIDVRRWERKFEEYKDISVIPKSKERVNADRKEF